MASSTVTAGKVGKHAVALAATQVDTVTFVDDLDQVEVYNATTAGPSIWATADGSTPVVGDDGCWEIPGGMARTLPVPTAGGTVIQLISSGTPTYSVSRV